MIGFNALGKLGRFGNQMFQFAATKGIARKHGYEFCIPPSMGIDEWKDHQLFIPFKMEGVNQLNVQFIDGRRPIVSEDGFGFNQNLFDTCPDWVTLQGFFQTEKYFKHIRKELLKDFQFKDDIRIPAEELIFNFENPIALHIRRTDYITNPNHSTLSLKYYESALKKFSSNAEVLIFSDDPSWCMEQELFSSDRFSVSQGNSNYMDMCLMTLCKGHIIANSSFSWWGAWLSDSDKVIAPSEWFKGSNNEHLDISDIIPDRWEKIQL
jgi:hypothetical protein